MLSWIVTRTWELRVLWTGFKPQENFGVSTLQTAKDLLLRADLIQRRAENQCTMYSGDLSSVPVE